MTHTIHVILINGEVQPVLGVPEGCTVEVHDLDGFSDPEYSVAHMLWEELERRAEGGGDDYDALVGFVRESGYDLREIEDEHVEELADKWFAVWKETSPATTEASTPMITAYNLGRVTKAMAEAQRIAKAEMPKSEFVLVGADNHYIYFNVVCRVHMTNEEQICDLKQKTRFHPLEETLNPVYVGKFKMSL